ncbi:acyltransferase family protein [Bradyrhizobium arachidis]|uniref:Acyltransferase n=1 Tax=Bradyrhizobium arachidis TaxID=858423 RepID=A0AAE7TG87_9BRAD|nr:acyltransferase [Bradyrhizobium arachidis]QOZ66939.1 acyltransferase [Bradyrhizobium arachidis]SFV13827.1 Peptidoglycan/LPS O-acetylase OafA/YrhL, contains acyltransferase and SGNH-hydrolase domains [Bradyrhizobium arachidis]
MHRNNNFNFIRAAAALAVLASHAYPIAGGSRTVQPFEPELGMHGGLGTLAVLVFFIVSGYFITQSALRSASLFDFWAARFLRIYPGLFVALSLTALLGVSISSLSVGAYFLSGQTYSYIPSGLSLAWVQYELPGVFDGNPFPQLVNGSLWTLFYEVLCYVMVSILAVLGILQNKTARAAFFATYLVLYVVAKLMLMAGLFPDWVSKGAINFLTHLLDLTPPFVIGMLFYAYRDRLPLNFAICAVLLVCTVLSANTPFYREMMLFSVAFCTFYIGFRSLKVLYSFNNLGDYSYGIYIYAFPIEQLVAYFFNGISPLGIIAIATPLTIGISAASWHTIEAPALALRSRIAPLMSMKRAKVSA